ncbi:MAG: hypothetical protein ACOYN0_08880, partial [Phycisphaerales bacterium]
MNRVLLALVAIAVAALPALAQSIVGEFQPVDNRWLASNGTNGIAYSGGAAISIDLNGNGIVGAAAGDPTDPVYTLPAESQNGLNYFLSPTRQYLYVTRSGVGGCGGGILNMRIYRLPFPVGPMELIHTDCLPCGAPYNGTPQFYETGLVANAPFAWGVSNQRLMFLVSRNSQTTCSVASSQLALRVYDLNVPGPSGRAMITLQEGWEPPIRVAQSGTACFIKNDLTSNPLDADYTLIDLCPGPNFGQPIFNADNVAGDVRAQVTSVSSGSLTYLVTDDGVNAYTNVFPDCLAGTSPVVGSCCVDGVCTQTTQAACTGAWAAATSCAANPCGPPPLPILSVSASAPATVQALQPFSYSIIATNSGTLAASSVTVQIVAPSGVNFVSQSGGDAGSSGTLWNITSLAPGQSRTLTATYSPRCTSATVTLSSYTIDSLQTNPVAGAPVVASTVIGFPTDPVTITATSTPSTSPLFAGDTIEHAITLTNATAANHQLISFSASAGDSSELAQQLDAGSGSFTTFLGNSMTWTGNLPPFSSTTIRFTTRIRACIFPTHTTSRLNDGSTITVSNRCSISLGSTLPPPGTPIHHPVSLSFQATNITPGLIGPPALAGSIFEGRTYQPVREGATALIAATFTNDLPTPIAALTGTILIPSSLVLADPPFVGAPPAGVTYSAASRTISYALPLAPGQSATIEFNVTVPVGATCLHLLELEGGTFPGCTDVASDLALISVKAPPQTDAIYAMNPSQGITYITESPLAAIRATCAIAEIWFGMDIDPTGNIWHAGIPLTKLNPTTLDFAMYNEAETSFDAITPCLMRDAAWDSTTSTLVTLHRSTTGGLGLLFRFDPATRQITHLITDPAFGTASDVAVDPDGAAIVLTPTGLRRIPLAGAAFPLPAGSGSTLALPVPQHNFGSVLGSLTSSSALRLTTRAPRTYGVTIANYYREDLGAPGQTPYTVTSVISLGQINPDGSSSILIPQLADYRQRIPNGIPTFPPQLSPLIWAEASSAPITNGAPGKLLVNGPSSPSFVYEADLTTLTGRAILPVSSFVPGYAELRFVPFAPACPADWDNANGVDGDDVIAFFADWDAGNADFNN